MKKILAITIAAAILLSVAGCSKKDKNLENATIPDSSSNEEKIEHNKSLVFENETLPQLWMPKTGDPIVTIETDLGDMHFLLFPEQAPNAVKNFTTLGEDGFYNNALFSQAVENFYIQSGAPGGTSPKSIFEKDGQSIGFQNEVSPHLWHFRGALAMRNDGETAPDSNTSEFFVVQAKIIGKDVLKQMKDTGYPDEVLDVYENKGGIPGYDMNYTVFGQLYAGEDVLDAIGETKVDKNNTPQKDIAIKNIIVGVYDEENPVPKSSGMSLRASDKEEHANKEKSTYKEPNESDEDLEDVDDIEIIQNLEDEDTEVTE